MKLKARWVLVFFLTTLVTAFGADDKVKSRAEAETLMSALKFQQGTISLEKNLATLHVPADMRFLDGHDAGTVLVKLWGNPPGHDPLGMLLPTECNILSDCWAVVITYNEDGYVKDGDAEKINYGELLTQMKKDFATENKERQRQGYQPIELVGWATPPRYDRANHKLYWAKDLKFGGEKDDTLNYNIRMLGRRGVMVLNAVASMSQLAEIESSTPKILGAIDFNAGSRYADFSATSGDKVAAYGIGALVAGGIAAKVGLFKGLWLLLLGAKKFIIIAVAAIAAWFRKTFGKKTVKPMVSITR